MRCETLISESEAGSPHTPMLLDNPAQPQNDLLEIDWMSEVRVRSCMIWGP